MLREEAEELLINVGKFEAEEVPFKKKRNNSQNVIDEKLICKEFSQ